MIEALKTIILINALIALAFAVFYELVQLCLSAGVSPWWAAVAYVVLYAKWWVNQCRSAPHMCAFTWLDPYRGCPDCSNELKRRAESGDA